MTLLYFLAVCFGTCQSQTPVVAFEVASVRAAPGADAATGSWSPPNTGSFTATHVTLARLLQLAYGIDASQISHKPAWFETNLYDVAAKPEQGMKLTRDELRPRLQNLLATRFQLKSHTLLLPTKGFALLKGEPPPVLTRTKADHFAGYRVNVSAGHMRGFNWSMPVFATYLSSALHRPVVDLTGLEGSYDIAFDYAEHEQDLESSAAELAAALKENTKLVLKAQQVPVFTLVIDAASPEPGEN